MNQNRCPKAFTLIELLIVVAIIGILLGLLLPALEKARESADNVRCAANLAQIGVAVLIYANDNHGNYPRTVYDPAAPLCVDTNAAAPDPFGAGGPNPNDETSPFFLLLRTEKLSAKIFNDPYTDELDAMPDPAPDLGNRSNFTNFQKNLAYSYANPYPSATAANAGYRLTSKLNSEFPIAADLNPGVAGMNSRNHERRGQNVLFADMHADWEKTTKCGISGDDIYTNKAGAIQASPTDADDAILLPVD